MKLPRHTSPDYDDRIARAPYNFVPLPEGVLKLGTDDAPGHDVYRGHSGAVTCTLTTSSLTYIRGMMHRAQFAEFEKQAAWIKDDAQRKEYARFFTNARGELAIPGSSLRGLLRAMIEIAAHGKVTRVSDRRMAYRSVDTTALGEAYRARIMDAPFKNDPERKNWFVPRMRGGFLRHTENGWFIQPAKPIGGATFCRVLKEDVDPLVHMLDKWSIDPAHDPQQIDTRRAYVLYVQPGAHEFQDVRGGFLKIKFARAARVQASEATGLVRAALIVSGHMDSKKSEAVIYPPDPAADNESAWFPLKYSGVKKGTQDRVEIDLEAEYREQISLGQRTILGDSGALHDGQPVFYLADGDVEIDDQPQVSGFATAFFGHTMMMRVLYKHSPLDLIPPELRDDDIIDIPDSLFGYVRAKRETDTQARACAGKLRIGDAHCLTADAYASAEPIKPKILSNPKLTTFQQYLTQGNPNDKGELTSYDDARASTIRGSKLYWHKGAVTLRDVAADPKAIARGPKQFTDIRPIRAGVAFEFTIQFDNLSDIELGALLWVLGLAKETSPYRFKLGMGKPHGLGSVSIDAQTPVLIDRAARYASFCGPDGALTHGKLDSVEAQARAQKAVAAFTAAVLANPGLNPGRVARIEDLPRIAEFLTLLRWDASNPQPGLVHTRYLEIERREHPDARRVNEFKERPVLPLPSRVGMATKGPYAPKSKRASDAPFRRRDAGGERLPEKRYADVPKIEAPEIRETASDEAKRLAVILERRAAQLGQGDEVQITIKTRQGADFVCAIEGAKATGKLAVDERPGLKPGDQIRARVKRETSTGVLILTLRGVR